MTASTLISDYIGVGPIADRPTTPSVGIGVEAFYYATDTSVQYAWNGSAWVALGGSIEVTNGTTTLTGVTTLTISSGITLTGSGSNGTLTASGGGGGGVSSLSPTLVQYASEIDAATSSTVTLGATPTAGNLLVALYSHKDNSPTVTSKWTELVNVNGSTYNGYSAAYRFADATDTATLTVFGTSGSGNALTVFEVANGTGVPVVTYGFHDSTASGYVFYAYAPAYSLGLGQILQQSSAAGFDISGIGTLTHVTSSDLSNCTLIPLEVSPTVNVATGVAVTMPSGPYGGHGGVFVYVPGTPGGSGSAGYTPGVGVPLVRPALSTLTISNQGTNTITDEGEGLPIAIQATEAGSLSIILLGKAESGSAWTHTLMAEVQIQQSAQQGPGIYVRDTSGNFTLAIHLPFDSPGQVQFLNLSSPTNYVSNAASPVQLSGALNRIWLRVQLSSGNLIFSWSQNGLLFDVMSTISATAFLGTISEVGFALSCQGSGSIATLSAYLWHFV